MRRAAHAGAIAAALALALAIPVTIIVLFTLLLTAGPPGTPCVAGQQALPAGATISVDASGNATSPYNGTGAGYVCTATGAWQRI